MRQTSTTDIPFPFTEDTTAFILVYTPETIDDTKDRRGFAHASTFDKKATLALEAQTMREEGHAVSLLAVWPGATRSDVFLVDDLDEAVAAFG